MNDTSICAHCGNTFRIKNPYNTNKYCGNPCRYAHKVGEHGPHWKGGQPVTGNGYVREYCPDHPYADPDGYVLQHRLVVERSIGRVLDPKEQVHHRDQNKQNNELPNLEVLSPKEHNRLHREIRKQKRWLTAEQLTLPID